VKYYDKKVEDVYKELKTTSNGLTSDDVDLLIADYGFNILEEKKKTSLFIKFLSQFNDTMIIILLVTALVMFIYGLIYSHEYTDTIVIVVVVLINAVMGFIQESKAEVTLEGLKEYSKTMTTVKRDGKWQLIDSELLVPGDIIKLQAGDKVPVDARIIESTNLLVDESALTGESTNVEKANIILKGELEIQNQVNMLFSGSSVTNGDAIAIITATGMNTEMGKIALSLNTPYKVETPLERKTKELSITITKLIFIILIIIFFYSLYIKNSVLETIMLCVSLAVAAIPEGLPAVITITLSNGTGVLSKKKAVVRQMQAVETLGSIDVICSDKTGTITQNKMQIKESMIYDEKMLDYIFILNNETMIDGKKMIGDPTEICLYDYVMKKNLDVIGFRKKNKRVISGPFDSERKMSTSVNSIDGKTYFMTKGSYENVLNRCKYILKDGKKEKLTDTEKEKIKSKCDYMGNKALRVMAYAYKETKKNYKKVEEVFADEKDLILAGIVGIIDPPRDTVVKSVLECKKASIKPVMITGDALITACAIAREVGIIEDNSEGILGSELDKYTDDELVEVVKKYGVYARVSPIHKERIVKAFQAQGKVVAMTGDGVNDAPAIKDAHVGVGMGITGTEVTKSVADVILLDDSFSTIVVAIEEGRRIYSNIRNNIVYSLSSNIAEIFIVLISMFLGYNILLPIHILFIDLVTDSIPSIALSFEKSERGVMNKPPRGIDRPLFTPFVISCIVSSAIIETFLALTVFFISKNFVSQDEAITLVLLSVVIQEIIYAIVCRNLKNLVYTQGIFSNKAMNIGIVIVLIIEAVFFLTPVGKIIDIVPLEFGHIMIIFFINMLSFIIYELLKPTLKILFKD